MAFTSAAGNFRQAWSAETTLAFLRKLTIGSRLNGAYDGNAMMNQQVFAQNPNYNVNVTSPARKANWGNPNEPEAARITINMDQFRRVENTLYVEDEVENAVQTYRGRLQQVSLHGLREAHETNIVDYILGLDDGAPGTGAANGNAGFIQENAYSAANTGFDHVTGKPEGNAAAQDTARGWVLDAFTDARVQLMRRDVDTMGDNDTVGGSAGSFWCAMPVELYTYGLAAALENKGIDLDFTRNIIRDIGVFGSAFMGHYRGFDMFVTNSLPKPSAPNQPWHMIMAADEAVAGPIRPVRNYVTMPENARAERYEFRHAVTFGRQLINSRLVVRTAIGAGQAIA